MGLRNKGYGFEKRHEDIPDEHLPHKRPQPLKDFQEEMLKLSEDLKSLGQKINFAAQKHDVDLRSEDQKQLDYWRDKGIISADGKAILIRHLGVSM